MTTRTAEKLYKDVQVLQEEVRGIKRFLFAPLKDSEGEYRRSFVRKMFSRAQQNRPFYRFINQEAFLKHASAKK